MPAWPRPYLSGICPNLFSSVTLFLPFLVVLVRGSRVREDLARRVGLLADPEDRLDRLPAAGVRDGLVDLLEVVVADQAVERELPLAVEADELRDEQLGD